MVNMDDDEPSCRVADKTDDDDMGDFDKDDRNTFNKHKYNNNSNNNTKTCDVDFSRYSLGRNFNRPTLSTTKPQTKTNTNNNTNNNSNNNTNNTTNNTNNTTNNTNNTKAKDINDDLARIASFKFDVKQMIYLVKYNFLLWQ